MTDGASLPHKREGVDDRPVPDNAIEDDAVRHLASYRKGVAQIRAAWPAFAARRQERLQQGGLFGPAVEKIAENILEDLFTTVLDWPVADVKPQLDRADIVLTRLSLKWLVLEVKRPGSLLGHRTAIDAALRQARGYAADQRVEAVAVSDTRMLYAADVIGGGLRHRARWPTPRAAACLPRGTRRPE